MTRAVVIVDVYRWHPSGEVGSEVAEAERGDEIEVSERELKRGLELGALAKPGAKKRAEEPAEPGEE